MDIFAVSIVPEFPQQSTIEILFAYHNSSDSYTKEKLMAITLCISRKKILA